MVFILYSLESGSCSLEIGSDCMVMLLFLLLSDDGSQATIYNV